MVAGYLSQQQAVDVADSGIANLTRYLYIEVVESAVAHGRLLLAGDATQDVEETIYEHGVAQDVVVEALQVQLHTLHLLLRL